MRLKSFTVKNFRSITNAYRLPLRDCAVLVGPNNSGKSNILKAIEMALGILSRACSVENLRSLAYL
jgi:putative ATP-dependent endonuclease of the OLD family